MCALRIYRSEPMEPMTASGVIWNPFFPLSLCRSFRFRFIFYFIDSNRIRFSVFIIMIHLLSMCVCACVCAALLVHQLRLRIMFRIHFARLLFGRAFVDDGIDDDGNISFECYDVRMAWHRRHYTHFSIFDLPIGELSVWCTESKTWLLLWTFIEPKL